MLRVDWHFGIDVMYCTRGADPTNAQAGTWLQHSPPGSIQTFPYLETELHEWELMFPHLHFSSKMWVLRHGTVCFS